MPRKEAPISPFAAPELVGKELIKEMANGGSHKEILLKIRAVESMAKLIQAEARWQEVALKVANHLGIKGTDVARMNMKAAE